VNAAHLKRILFCFGKAIRQAQGDKQKRYSGKRETAPKKLAYCVSKDYLFEQLTKILKSCF
jgi:uncharacterized Rmd1/YagE family protein